MGHKLFQRFSDGSRRLTSRCPLLEAFSCCILGWLCSNGSTAEAMEVLHFVANCSGQTLPVSAEMKVTAAKDPSAAGSIGHMCRTMPTAKTTARVAAAWFLVGFAYYGISMDAANLGPSLPMSVFLSGLIEVPFNFAAQPILSRGRRWGTAGFFLVTGVCCCLTAVSWIPDWLELPLAVTGKGASQGAFCAVYFLAAELFPTSHRNLGMGLASLCARIASTVAPFVVLLAEIWKPMPLVVFGSSAFLALCVVLPLRETSSAPLCDSIEEYERTEADHEGTFRRFQDAEHGTELQSGSARE
mmetsp:Transcript_69860/g.186054  ORF Transcript_69860/g.186054 Transcript_69860/m.186054 type:complete len:300 (-) Transcript_69860:240-1139(-)